jgi:hypothetical protein
MIVNSVIEEQIPQVDGRIDVTEKHTYDDGATQYISYLASAELDLQLVANLRAENINKQLELKALAEAEAMNFEIPLFKAEFRDRFTTQEQIYIDNFNASYQSNPNLSTEQKAGILSALAYYADAGRVYLSHPKTISFVNMYEQLGILAEGRAAEVLNG